MAYIVFIATLSGVAMYHERKLSIAVLGLALAALLAVTHDGVHHVRQHVGHEALALLHLGALLVGFAFLSEAFSRSAVGNQATRWLPDGWTGGLAILSGVFLLSGVLDNIAAALVGIGLAQQVYGGRVALLFAGTVVAAANAGGAGSVLGDTTTTMIWLGGVASWTEILKAYAPAVIAAGSLSIYAAYQQHVYQPIQQNPEASRGGVSWLYLWMVGSMLAAVVAANVAIGYPAVGLWMVLSGVAIACPHALQWRETFQHAAPDALFLLALVAQAGLVPVSGLPAPNWTNTVAIGFVSAVFDNIPLTALAVKQGGYDWAHLAFAVGYGGSMVWFGSSAGVAVSGIVPEMQDTRLYMRRVGVYVAAAYVFASLVTYPLFR